MYLHCIYMVPETMSTAFFRKISFSYSIWLKFAGFASLAGNNSNPKIKIGGKIQQFGRLEKATNRARSRFSSTNTAERTSRLGGYYVNSNVYSSNQRLGMRNPIRRLSFHCQ